MWKSIPDSINDNVAFFCQRYNGILFDSFICSIFVSPAAAAAAANVVVTFVEMLVSLPQLT